MPQARLAELERKLRSLSHSEEAIQEVQRFSSALDGTKERLAVWNATRAILRKPIESAEAAALGFDTADDAFAVLQGDVIGSESAYFFGERVTGRSKYAVLNSTCDLVPGRSSYAAFLRFLELHSDEEKAKEKLGTPEEHAQDGHGVERAARRDGEFLQCLAARSRALCASEIHATRFDVPSGARGRRAGCHWQCNSVRRDLPDPLSGVTNFPELDYEEFGATSTQCALYVQVDNFRMRHNTGVIRKVAGQGLAISTQ